MKSMQKEEENSYKQHPTTTDHPADGSMWRWLKICDLNGINLGK